MEEIEIKFLDIDVLALTERLKYLGAQQEGEYFYRRIHLDYPDLQLDKSGQWLRLRDDGNHVTLTHKKMRNFVTHDAVNKDVVIDETEIIVNDFDKTKKLFLESGFIQKSYQENKRIRYSLNGVEIDIDFWPLIPPYVEIEGPTLSVVHDVARLLGFDIKDAVRYTSGLIYERHYGIDLHSYSIFTFDAQVKK